jgi:hypothetical protein
MSTSDLEGGGPMSDVELILEAAAGAERRTDRLRELEEVVERGLATFVEVGRALQEIRDAQLYRATHAYRLIDAAEVKVALSPIGDIRNEAQARELVPLWRKNPTDAEQVWRDAGADTSARDLKTLVTRRLGQIERAEYGRPIRVGKTAELMEPDPERQVAPKRITFLFKNREECSTALKRLAAAIEHMHAKDFTKGMWAELDNIQGEIARLFAERETNGGRSR